MEDQFDIEESAVRATMSLPGNPRIVTRDEHNISRAKIDRDALKVLYRLHHSGYHAFLVGGGVRDLLLDRQPKDFDVGTDARPNEIRRLFKNSRPIGRRFRLVQVFFRSNKIVEVSTFRASSPELEDTTEAPLLAADNTYGDPESDARRRDLTINGLFYDISTFSVIDYVGGVADLENKIIRIIGNAWQRIQEDPVRMIRAVRHAARTGFTIEPDTTAAIRELGHLLPLCPKARIMEEFLRELSGACAFRSFRLMDETGMLRHMVPFLGAALEKQRENTWRRLEQSLKKVDFWLREGSEVPTWVIFAALISAGSTELESDNPAYLSMQRAIKLFTVDARSMGQLPESSDEESELIRELCRQLFHVIGIYRRDIDGIVKIVRQRRDLIASYLGEIPLIRNLGQYRDAVTLLELTAWDEETEGAVGFWRQRLGNLFSHHDRPEDGHRNEFRRRRRGGRSRPRRR